MCQNTSNCTLSLGKDNNTWAKSLAKAPLIREMCNTNFNSIWDTRRLVNICSFIWAQPCILPFGLSDSKEWPCPEFCLPSQPPLDAETLKSWRSSLCSGAQPWFQPAVMALWMQGGLGLYWVLMGKALFAGIRAPSTCPLWQSSPSLQSLKVTWSSVVYTWVNRSQKRPWGRLHRGFWRPLYMNQGL